MNKISCVIVVKNNPPYLFKVIDSIIDICHEIVIVDIGIDNAVIRDLLKIKKIKLVKSDEHIPYVELIREKTKKYIKCDYVMFLDPDEIVPPDLKKFLINNIGKYDYIKIPRKNIIFGRWIKHSRWWPDYQIRFFKKDKVTWPKIIHRQPKASGTFTEIPPLEKMALLHYNYRDLDEYFSKAMRYAKHEAKEFFIDGKELTFRESVRRAVTEFISRYFSAEGYKDGIQGFMLASFQMFYYFLVYFYYIEIKQFKTNEAIDEIDFFRLGLKESLHYKKKASFKEKIIKKLL